MRVTPGPIHCPKCKSTMSPRDDIAPPAYIARCSDCDITQCGHYETTEQPAWRTRLLACARDIVSDSVEDGRGKDLS